MRIFFASDTTPNYAIESSIWETNLYCPLVDLGHDVVKFDYDMRETFRNLLPEIPEHRTFIEMNRPRLSAELVRQIEAAHAQKRVDLFFSYFYDACVSPEAIDAIRSMGITTVNWYCNGSYQLHLVERISPHYDWCLVPERYRLADYEAMGARPVYCQEAANPSFYRPYHVPIEYDVTFIGQAYGERPAHIKYLLDRGIDVRVWGHGWATRQALSSARLAWLGTIMRRMLQVGRRLVAPGGWRAAAQRLFRPSGERTRDKNGESFEQKLLIYGGGILSDAEMVKMYSRSRINLGFSACGSTHVGGNRIVQIRLRDFEVPMSGGFYMVEYMEELEEFYAIGREIVCYTGVEDLAEKIAYYLRHESERESIRRAGYERCRREHTWQRRFQTVFARIGLN